MRYIIGDVAKLLGVSTNTVRRYEEMGYIKSYRDQGNGYRYYNEEGISEFMNIRMMRKYGFSHEELELMKYFDVEQEIEAYETKLKDMDEKIAYMSYLRNRLNGNVNLMKKLEEFSKGDYVRDCVDMTYVLYQSGSRLLKDSGRIRKVQEFLYECPEVQRILIIRKEDIEKNQIVVNMGWATKTKDLEKYCMKSDEYMERYEKRRSVMALAKVTAGMEELIGFSSERLKEIFLASPLQYINEQNLQIAGDVLGVVITNAVEKGQRVMYVLVSVPIIQVL